jgi:uncharacterized phage protein gp47/JayE
MSIPVSKTLDEVRNDLFQKISDVQEAGNLPQKLNLNKGVVRGLIEVWAWGLYQLYQFLLIVFKQLFPALATGLWLDLHCAQVGVKRQQATKALGKVRLSRVNTEDNITIRKGMVFKTKVDGAGNVYRFVVTEKMVLPAGQESLQVNVESEDYGAQANVSEGMICEMSTVIPGIDAVSNDADWLSREAVDQENDDPLRERYALAWQESNGVTKYAYESWARSVSGVVAVKVMDQHPRGQGTVDVIIKGSAGIPTQELLDEVGAAIALKRPLNDDAKVLSPVPVEVSITGELVLVSGTPDNILAEVEERIRALFQDPPVLDNVAPLEIAEDLTLDRLTHLAMAVKGIKKINWGMSIDIQVPETGLAVLGGINLTYAWAGEI